MCFICEHINSFITHVSIITNICVLMDRLNEDPWTHVSIVTNIRVLMVLMNRLNEDPWVGSGVFFKGCNTQNLAKRSYVKGQKCGALQKQMSTQKWTLQMKANN
jgi:hypothetical protein